MADSEWYPFQAGETLGEKGSEDGTILRDEEHPLGARITLERDARTVPFTITCGIYGCMMHTRFFRVEQNAQTGYGLMKSALSNLMEKASECEDGDYQVLLDGVHRFVETYP